MINKQGLLLCAKYSVAPNYFGYCGPDENVSLVDHLKEQVADGEVQSILKDFTTLHLNLTLIAKQNHIDDVFDRRVVEAYWVGNSLLEHVSSRDYAYLLDEKFKLEKKLGVDKFGELKHKILLSRLYPHHSFHVFNIFKRTGHDPSFHTLRTMDECRIGWGEVIENNIHTIIVYAQPLAITNTKLHLSKKEKKKLQVEYKGKQFLSQIKKGDYVSFHWSHVCDVIEISHMRQLRFYTQKAIDFFNNQ